MRELGSRRGLTTHLAALALASALASPGFAAQPEERKITTQEVEHWLDSPSGAPGAPADEAADAAEAPPPAPRHHGFVIESGIGVLGHLGPMKNVSPAHPQLRLKAGIEPLDWLLLFGEAEIAFGNTSYAHPPPPPRTYALYSFGGGARVTLAPTDIVGFYLEGSLGTATASEDVLQIYGFSHADELNSYAGAALGIDWYQVNPHLALALHGGVRYYGGFDRERDTASPLAWLSGVSLRYTF